MGDFRYEILMWISISWMYVNGLVVKLVHTSHRIDLHGPFDGCYRSDVTWEHGVSNHRDRDGLSKCKLRLTTQIIKDPLLFPAFLLNHPGTSHTQRGGNAESVSAPWPHSGSMYETRTGPELLNQRIVTVDEISRSQRRLNMKLLTKTWHIG